MKPRVLFVDDEPNVLASFERLFRKDFAVDTALGGPQALEKISAATEPYKVIVSDMRMPEMTGDAFLAQAKLLEPTTIRMVLTGETNIASAMNAVNDGAIFRFLLKPCSEPALRAAIETGIRQYDLERTERDLLEKTLSGSVKVLTEVLSLVNPSAFGRALRIRRYVRHITTKLETPNAWQFDIAAMLCQVGCVTLSPATLESMNAGRTLSEEDMKRFRAHPAIARDLLTQVPRLEPVAEMIARQNESFSPDDGDDPVAQGAAMLRVCLDFDQLVSKGQPPEDALRALATPPNIYSPAMLAALEDVGFDTMIYRPDVIPVAALEPSMVIDEDLRGATGMLLAARGQEVNAALKLRLKNLSELGAIPGSVKVLVLRPGFESEPAPEVARSVQ